jgi:hypothetical protein
MKTCTFMVTPQRFLLRMADVSNESCKENLGTRFMFNNFFPIILPYMRQCGNILQSQAGHRWQYDACTLHAGYLRLQTHSLNMEYFLFSTATMTAWTCLNITSYTHFLSCWQVTHVYYMNINHMEMLNIVFLHIITITKARIFLQKLWVPLHLLEVQRVLYRYFPENFGLSINTIYTAHQQHFIMCHISHITQVPSCPLWWIHSVFYIISFLSEESKRFWTRKTHLEKVKIRFFFFLDPLLCSHHKQFVS